MALNTLKGLAFGLRLLIVVSCQVSHNRIDIVCQGVRSLKIGCLWNGMARSAKRVVFFECCGPHKTYTHENEHTKENHYCNDRPALDAPSLEGSLIGRVISVTLDLRGHRLLTSR